MRRDPVETVVVKSHVGQVIVLLVPSDELVAISIEADISFNPLNVTFPLFDALFHTGNAYSVPLNRETSPSCQQTRFEGH